MRLHRSGTKRFCHSVVGELTLSFEALQPTADANLALVAYTAEPGSRSAEALALLASWSATEELEQAAAASPPSPAQPL